MIYAYDTYSSDSVVSVLAFGRDLWLSWSWSPYACQWSPFTAILVSVGFPFSEKGGLFLISLFVPDSFKAIDSHRLASPFARIFLTSLRGWPFFPPHQRYAVVLFSSARVRIESECKCWAENVIRPAAWLYRFSGKHSLMLCDRLFMARLSLSSDRSATWRAFEDICLRQWYYTLRPAKVIKLTEYPDRVCRGFSTDFFGPGFYLERIP